MATQRPHRWPEKPINNEKKKTVKLMKCMNSDPKHSKWAEYYEGDGPCEEWVEVDIKTTAVLCSKCTQMTLK